MKTIRLPALVLCSGIAFGLTLQAFATSHCQTATNKCVSITGISSPGFNPANFTITAGQKVTWKKDDTSGTRHTVTKTGGTGAQTWSPLSFSNQGDEGRITFTKPGTYTYQCNFHRSTMNGSFTVNPAPSPTSPPPTTSTPPPPPPPPGGGGSSPTPTPKTSPKATPTQTQSGTSSQASPAETASPQESPTAEASPSASASPSITRSPAGTPGAQGRTSPGLPPGLIGLVVIVLLALSGGGVAWWMSHRGW